MKTYTATVLITFYQTITVQAENREDAEMEVIERFDQNKACTLPAEVYDLEEAEEV